MTSTEKKCEDGEDIDNFNVIQDPNTLAALQEKIGQMTIKKMEQDELDLPPEVRRRVNAIKNIQLETTKIEADFFKEVHKLEIEYAKKYDPLYKWRAQIVSGEVEPSASECKLIGEENERTDNEIQENDNESAKGIPGFWVTIFKNTEILAEMTQPHDEPILESLLDIRVSFPETMGFVLEFVFAENEFFEERILTKTYHMKSEPDVTDPVAFDGPEIIGSNGCTINWKKGKNVTQKIVKKKQRMRGKGQTRVIQKTIKEDSFFNFFSPPAMPEDEESVDEELEALLTTDFEIGQYIRERIIPKAIWYYTNEVTDIESDMEDGESDEDYSDTSDYDDEVDNNENIVANETVTDVQKEECKQQ